jgi:hypothetical protein
MRLEIAKATFQREFGLSPGETESMTRERMFIWEMTLNKLMEKQADLVASRLAKIISRMFGGK